MTEYLHHFQIHRIEIHRLECKFEIGIIGQHRTLEKQLHGRLKLILTEISAPGCTQTTPLSILQARINRQRKLLISRHI